MPTFMVVCGSRTKEELFEFEAEHYSDALATVSNLLNGVPGKCRALDFFQVIDHGIDKDLKKQRLPQDALKRLSRTGSNGHTSNGVKKLLSRTGRISLRDVQGFVS